MVRYIHTVTLADGSTATRTSQSRNYTHVVVATYKSAQELRVIRADWCKDWADGPHKDAVTQQNMTWCDRNGGTQVAVTWCGNENLGRKALAAEQSKAAKRGNQHGYAKLALLPCTMVTKGVK